MADRDVSRSVNKSRSFSLGREDERSFIRPTTHGARCLPHNVLLNTHQKGPTWSYGGPRLPNPSG